MLGRVAQHAIDSGDGYAAREVLGFRHSVEGVTYSQQATLKRITAQAGIGLGELPAGIVRSMTTTAATAAIALDLALRAAMSK